MAPEMRLWNPIALGRNASAPTAAKARTLRLKSISDGKGKPRYRNGTLAVWLDLNLGGLRQRAKLETSLR